MQEILLGLVAIVIGLGVGFMGLRLWFFMLPIWGFVAGFFVGVLAVTAIFGDGFLSTVTGWVVGIVVGIAFSVLSYLFWYVGAIMSAASVGALLASGLIGLFGVDNGAVLAIAGIIGAVAFAFLALALALPVYIVVINTAFAGAAIAVAGVALVFDQIESGALRNGAAWAFINDHWLWSLAWIGLAVAGAASQMQLVDRIVLPEDKWTAARPAT